jgi:hypothetical protein
MKLDEPHTRMKLDESHNRWKLVNVLNNETP